MNGNGLDTDRFYLPYQFVPVTGTCNGRPVGEQSAAIEHIAAGTLGHQDPGAGARHDLWIQGHRSGRIRCRLTTETPTFIGARRGEGEPTPVEPATGPDGQPIIPGNSLRGVIGSIAETLSQSAMRVLERRTLSVRAQIPNDALSAIGRIRVDPETDNIRLQPLTLPALNGNKLADGRFEFDLPEKWDTLFGLTDNKVDDLAPFLPFYFDGYALRGDDEGGGMRVKGGTPLASVRAGHGSDTRYRLDPAESPSVPAEIRRSRGRLQIMLSGQGGAHIKRTVNRRGEEFWFLVGSKPTGAVRDVRLARDVQDPHAASEFPGWLRILDISPAESSVPTGKRHERFVPVFDSDDSIAFAHGVIDNFNGICNDRWEESKDKPQKFPFVPLGGQTLTERADSGRWLQEGDLVHFNVSDSGGQVTAVSFSAIWRRAVPGTLEGAFSGIAERSLPYGKGHTMLTPAELLFGVVREAKKATPGTTDLLPALAGRLRFHDARLTHDNGTAVALPLQILSAPKPPSPAFYFQSNDRQNGVRKAQLDLNKHKPNGRKFYLHHPEAQIAAQCYQSGPDALRKQKVKIAPLEPGNVFEFDIHYDNLSSAELHLLLTSLRPAEDFRHRIGMGKPLGLGTVRIDVIEVCEVDRAKRYGEDALDAAREHQTWHCDREFKQGTCAATVANSKALVDPDSHAILCRIGAWADKSPTALEPNVPVCYPRTREQLSAFVDPKGAAEQAEAELFKWNVANDRERGAGYQALQPVPTEGTMKPFSVEPQGGGGTHGQGGPSAGSSAAGRPGDRHPSKPRR